MSETVNPRTRIVLVEKQVLEYPSHLHKTVQKEFNSDKLRRDMKNNFKKIPYPYYRRAQGGPPVSPEEVEWARRGLDQWILEHWKKQPEVIEAYEKFDKIPDKIEEALPELLRPHWEILTEVNQNTTQKCSYLQMDKKPSRYDQLDVYLWSGVKVLGPFTTELKNYYRILTVYGPQWQLDPFLKEYRIG